MQKGFFFQSAEIYGNVAGLYDYGPMGSKVLNKIVQLWRRYFVVELGAFELHTSLITPAEVLKASGHADNFTDPLLVCHNCGAKFRADHLIKEQTGEDVSESVEDVKMFLEHTDVKCPQCGSVLKDVRTFNLMFDLGVGADRRPAFLRPETAQGIFVSFPRLWRTFGGSLPMMVAQIGKSFRNEISPRNALVRMREFTQMELEVFYTPEHTGSYDLSRCGSVRFWSARDQERGREPRMYAVEELKNVGLSDMVIYFLCKEWSFYEMLGVDMARVRFRELRADERPHYSQGNVDMEVLTSIGWIETIGNALRGSYDLERHQRFSSKSFAVNNTLPHVFEVSFGLDRLFFVLLDHNFVEQPKPHFALRSRIAPYDVAVASAVKDEGVVKRAMDLTHALRAKGFDVWFLRSGNLEKKMDKARAVGIPVLVMVDWRERDVSAMFLKKNYQYRVSQEELEHLLYTMGGWREV